MKFLFGMIVLVISESLLSAQERSTPVPQQRYAAVTCFKTGEKRSGMNKICFYNCLGSEAAITISSVELCPLTIQSE
jgi:hypothetical protein